MDQNSWPALKICKHQCGEAKDRLSQLPDDTLFSIISSLTMNEAAKISVLSRGLNYMWRCYPVLIFEDYSATTRMFEDRKSIPQERSNFLRWVNRVVEAHLGPTIDEFRVTFHLDDTCQSDVDKWMIFALAKRVKILELNFRRLSCGPKPPHVHWRICVDQPHNLAVFKSYLRSLTLRCVNVTSEDIEFLLLSCTVLENLCIDHSTLLTHVRALDTPLKLKHLEVSYCSNLESIDILVPKLLSFRNHGFPVKLHIRNASLLSMLSVGDICYRGDSAAYTFDSVSKYLSQLKYLSLHMRLSHSIDEEFNLGINNPPVMKNLRHLKFEVFALCEQSLLGWADLIEACPLLQRLTVTISSIFGEPRRMIEKRNGKPLKSLEVLEFSGNLGLPIDLEFMTYVVENSISLKDVIVEFRPVSVYLKNYVRPYDHDAELKRLEKLHLQGVNLISKTMAKRRFWRD